MENNNQDGITLCTYCIEEHQNKLKLNSKANSKIGCAIAVIDDKGVCWGHSYEKCPCGNLRLACTDLSHLNNYGKENIKQ